MHREDLDNADWDIYDGWTEDIEDEDRHDEIKQRELDERREAFKDIARGLNMRTWSGKEVK